MKMEEIVKELKRRNPVDNRDFDLCMHRSGQFCRLYKGDKLCSIVEHRDPTQCIYRDKTKFKWGDPDYERALVKSFELFMGDDMPIEMDAAGKKIEVVPHKVKTKDLFSKKKKVLGKNPILN